MQVEKILGVKDAARLLGVGYRKMQEFMGDGEMRVINMGNRRYGVTESELARWQKLKAQVMPTAQPKRKATVIHYDPKLFDENGRIRRR